MNIKINEKGQSLVIIAIAFFVLVAIAALLIDGGILYLNRRAAQTAADAAAMAGAHELCVNNGSTTDIQNVVNQYAITENGATAVEDLTIDASDYSVSVTTRLEMPSFFASTMGYATNAVRATASAKCFPPGATEGVLPIAWTCQPPVGGSTDTCVIHSIPWDVFQDLFVTVDPPSPWFNFGPGTSSSLLLTEGDGVNHGTYTDAVGGIMTYLLMDSSTFNSSLHCVELNPVGGTINCDFNNDGILEVEGGANRGWLLLDGTGASDLSNIIRYGYPSELLLPQWFPGKNGVSNSVFDTANDIKFYPSLVPVFNGVCTGVTAANIPTNCPDYVAGDLIRAGSGNLTYYRVPSVAAFVITCVSKNPSMKCPGKALAGVDHNVSTIEGYFVSGYTGRSTSIDPNGFYLGVYIVSLTE